MTDEEFMEAALSLAGEAYLRDEIPVGAVIVQDGNVISSGSNENREKNDATLHAEIIAIKKASLYLNNERLTGCDLYVTKEPCAMCAGAIVHSRIRRVIIGTEDSKYGACGTVLDVCGNSRMNHVPEIQFGILREKSSSLLKKFFLEKRLKTKISS
ncbi:MAG TPA: tRNA adenosine(34) deaminase TadA [Spirochaetota bacterium]|nr:tRNA adenosine(34) deaminase TadA [Spirochaetota bacterium]HPS85455.1 tRNA adenosine(34) deaminase TadA [Spirochaetota bacterium]